MSLLFAIESLLVIYFELILYLTHHHEIINMIIQSI